MLGAKRITAERIFIRILSVPLLFHGRDIRRDVMEKHRIKSAKGQPRLHICGTRTWKSGSRSGNETYVGH